MFIIYLLGCFGLGMFSTLLLEHNPYASFGMLLFGFPILYMLYQLVK